MAVKPPGNLTWLHPSSQAASLSIITLARAVPLTPHPTSLATSAP